MCQAGKLLFAAWDPCLLVQLKQANIFLKIYKIEVKYWGSSLTNKQLGVTYKYMFMYNKQTSLLCTYFLFLNNQTNFVVIHLHMFVTNKHIYFHFLFHHIEFLYINQQITRNQCSWAPTVFQFTSGWQPLISQDHSE